MGHGGLAGLPHMAGGVLGGVFESRFLQYLIKIRYTYYMPWACTVIGICYLTAPSSVTHRARARRTRVHGTLQRYTL